MSYKQSLTREIHRELDRLASQKKPMLAKWVTHTICSQHLDSLANDKGRDFWVYCGYEAVRDKVRRAINRRAGDGEEDKSEQFILPGYSHVHEYYVVKRGGEEQAIHVDEMTSKEILDRADLYRSMGKSCFAHASELIRYEKNRNMFAEAS